MPPKRARKSTARVFTPVPEPEPDVEMDVEKDEPFGQLRSLPGTFPEAVEALVERTRAAVDDSVTMFKLELAAVPGGQSWQQVAEALAVKARSSICRISPLGEVRRASLPDNGCTMLFDERQYSEALLHAVRAHFAFVQFERRLILTSTAPPREPEAAAQLLYVFSYLRTPAELAEPAAVRDAVSKLGKREANRRRTMAVTPLDSVLEGSSIGDQLEQFKDDLDRAERELLEASRRSADELSLPEPAALLDTSLESVPAPRLGTALHTVLGRPGAAPRGAPRGAVGVPRAAPPPAEPAPPPAARRQRPAEPAPTPAPVLAARRQRPAEPAPAPAPVRRLPAQRKRRHSASPAPLGAQANDHASRVTPPRPAQPATTTPRPHKSPAAAHLPDGDQLLAFFRRLNGAQSEQSRVALTCRYAKVRFGRDVASGALYRLVEAAGERTPPPPPAPLTETQQRETALQQYGELDSGQTEQSRVAYVLQYMRVQHDAKISANTMYGWLGQGAKRPAKKARH